MLLNYIQNNCASSGTIKQSCFKNAIIEPEKVIANARGFTQGPITQTMLCRTTFDPINKAVSDTLQITWSVQLTDNSVS